MPTTTPIPGTAPGLPATSRRASMAALPLAGVALALPAVATEAPPGDTAILALFREWKGLHLGINFEIKGMSDAQLEAVTDVMLEIEDRMMALPSTSPADFAAKLIAFSGNGSFSVCGESAPLLWAEAQKLTGWAA